MAPLLSSITSDTCPLIYTQTAKVSTVSHAHQAHLAPFALCKTLCPAMFVCPSSAPTKVNVPLNIPQLHFRRLSLMYVRRFVKRGHFAQKMI